MKMPFKSDSALLLLIAGVAVAIVVFAFALADYSQFGATFASGSSATCVGVLRLEGEIVSQGSLFSGEISPDEVVAALEKAEDDPAVGSILLEINTGGGSAVASKEIYDALRESGKPSVSYLRELAASGGYYIASGTDYIVSNPNTITGSIGARTTVINYEELFNKLGLRQENIKTGELKDIGEGNRNLTEQEKEILQTLLNETFDNFRKDVESGREGKLNSQLFATALDARILSAKQALNTGLVDEVGGRSAALKKAAQLANLTFDKTSEIEECALVEPNSFFDLISAFSTSLGRSIASSLSARHSGVQYS